MKHKYAAKVYIKVDEIIENTSSCGATFGYEY